jgi:ankyrin repeat protein
MLLGAGAYQNVGDADGLTPLHHAVKLEHEEVVGVLLKANANPNHLSRAHYTPVHFACKLGNVPLVRALLRSRGKKDIKTKDTHSTPLHLAVLTRNQAVLEVLLETGESSFDINVTDSYGYTPLHRASQMGLPVMVRLLVSHGASKSFRGRWDWTALHWAASCGHGEVVRVLLELGAVQGIEDNDGNIAYDVAIDEGVRGLLDPAAHRINARDNIHDRPASRQRSYTGIRGEPLDVATPSSRPDEEDSSLESTPRHDTSLKVLANRYNPQPHHPHHHHTTGTDPCAHAHPHPAIRKATMTLRYHQATPVQGNIAP